MRCARETLVLLHKLVRDQAEEHVIEIVLELLLLQEEPAAHPPFYLTEDEIRALMADEDLLRAEIGKALAIFKLPSAAKVARERPELDDDGDLIRRRRRR